MDDELEFDDVESQTLIQHEGLQACVTFVASDSDGRCAETCELDLHGTPDDVIASLYELSVFLKKYKSEHTFTASGE